MHAWYKTQLSSSLLARADEQALLLCIVCPSTSKCGSTVLLSESLYPGLELWPEMPDETLQRPCERLAERADGVSLNLLGQLLEHVDLALPRLALGESVHNLVCPLAALSARCALTAGLVVVELCETCDGADNISRLVHDDDSGGTETGLRVLESVEVHELVVADVLGKNGSRRTTGDDGLEVVPAADDTAAVLVDELTERNRHLLLDGTGVVDVARNGKELGTLVALTAEACEPATSTTADGGCDSDGLDVGDGGRTSEQTDGSGERGLQAGLSGLAFERLDERCLLTTDVGAHASVDVDIKVVAGTAGVLADEAGLVCLLDSALEHCSLVVELSSNIDVGGSGVHGTPSDEAALDQLVWVLAHNLAVLAGSGLTLIGVDDQVAGLTVLVPVLEVHE
jgi:hypothetical protein